VSRGRSRLALAAVVCAAVASVSLRAGQVTRRESDQFRQKIAAIVDAASRPARAVRRTNVSENEVNAYLAYDVKDQIPVGVVNPTVTILGTGRVTGRAIVDLDAVRKQQQATSLFDPASYLTGRLPVTATGVLQTGNGIGKFQLESATVGGVPVPKILLQQIVTYYSRSPDNPGGIGLDAAFALPARIREIQVQRGQAIIVQ
jgi:hypothetical protein